MYIKTKNAVTYNLPINGTATEIVSGRILACVEPQNFEAIKVKYIYLDPNENIVGQGMRTFTKEEMNAIFETIKDGLPDINSTDWDLWRKTQMNTAFMYEMAETFGIKVADIELVTEEGK